MFSSAVQGRSVAGVRAAIVVVMLASAVYYGVFSLHWPLMVDSPIMHYVTFLMDHGMKPYREITDNNMPGSYLTEAWAMQIFGGGDLAWRVYEFTLLGALTSAMVVIARPYDWVAGIYAGGLFLVMHGSEGPWEAVEREEVMTALLMIGYAAMFSSVRSKRPSLMLLLGLATGLAGSIKPTVAPLMVCLFLLAAYVLRGKRANVAAYLGWGALGLLLIGALDLGFLLRYGVMHDFEFVLRTVLPAYARLHASSSGGANLLRQAAPFSILALALLGVLIAWMNRDPGRNGSWERWALVMGAAFGLFSYFIQGKGFQHHRYTFLSFLFLLLGIEFLTALRRTRVSAVLGLAGIAATLLVLVPRYLESLSGRPANSDLTLALEHDLDHLGGTRLLQDKVQCFDLVYGCLDALYHLQIVENTGFTGDLLFFSGTGTPASEFYRDKFWTLARKDPATVLVLSNEWFGEPNSFEKIDAWPQFAGYLHENYTMVVSRTFPLELHSRGEQTPDPMAAPAYRIYIRNKTPLLARSAKWGEQQIVSNPHGL